MIKLISFNKKHILKEWIFLRNLKNESGFENDCYKHSLKEFRKIDYPKFVDYSIGKNLPTNYVPSTRYYLYKGHKIVGAFNVRHYLNKYLENGAGHIGYCIKPKYRRRGYATIGLKLAIKELLNMPDFKEDEIYLSCNINNIGSFKCMINNGGYLHHEDENNKFIRIKKGFKNE